MYPGSQFTWHDNSNIVTTTIDSVDNSPLYLHVSSFDRGPEELIEVSGKTFYDLYGTKMNFAKHGQPAIQAANMIDGGARLLIKRLVADDATLANLVAVATVKTVINAVEADPDDPEGKTLEEFGVVEEVPTTTKYVVAGSESSIKWSAVGFSGCMTVNDVEAEAAKLMTSETTADTSNPATAVITKIADYPLIGMSDNGRGLSNKSFKISPDYTTSKDMENMFYNIYIFDGTTTIEKLVATFNPAAIYNSTLYGLNEDSSIQVKFFNIDGAFDAYVENISEITGLPVNIIKRYDMINAKNNKGASLMEITIDPESVDLNSPYGVNLVHGTNGNFGNTPFGTDAWTEAAVSVFDGTYDDSIWDVDTYKIAAVFDANYPVLVKEAIAKFVTFREDCVYLRDYGVDNLFSYASIIAFQESIDRAYRNKFIADYYTTYQIFDPDTKKRIRVTMLYDLSRAMVKHFANGCYRPVAGTANDMVLPNAIEGTINFTPRITPNVNQKALLDDAKINYAIFEGGVCVVQSTYSAQEDFTQLSFINNVMAIQEVVRAVRTACPKQRYTFTTGSDFSLYADAVNAVLRNFISNFAELRFEYEQDSLKAAQKIFYASIYFRFNNWAQTESFDLYALPNE